MTGLKSVLLRMLHSELPVPGCMRPLVRGLYRLGVVLAEGWRLLYKWLVVAPVMRSVASVGRSLRIERIPYIRGRGRITIGRNVYISGKVDIGFSRHSGEPPAPPATDYVRGKTPERDESFPGAEVDV